MIRSDDRGHGFLKPDASSSPSPLPTSAALSIPVLALDAAECCGVALVLPREPLTGHPRLAAAWGFKHASYERWLDAAEEILREALGICTQLHLPPPFCVTERAEGRRNLGATLSDAMQGLGRRQGLALAAWRTIRPPQSRVGQLVRQGWWVERLGLQPGKAEGGAHRIREARRALAGAEAILSAVPTEMRIDAAEAALLGAAVSLFGGEL